jgi:tetrahydromethanopterin S-methyltransferase subunit B
MRNEYIKIEDEVGYVKDTRTGAILNINRNEVEAARERKKLRKLQEQELEEMKETVHDLKNEMSEVKQLLNKIAERL